MQNVLVQFGTNEVMLSTNVFITDYPNWQTSWQTNIDTLVSAGVKIVSRS